MRGCERRDASYREEWNLRFSASSKWDEGTCCRWVYTVKLNLDGSLANLKARLAAKGYSQMYKVDYQDTFSSVLKITSMSLISLTITYRWLLHQLDIMNALLHGVVEGVYMEQPSGFVCCLGGVRESLLVEKIIIWAETIL